jgi:hypothetical protein
MYFRQAYAAAVTVLLLAACGDVGRDRFEGAWNPEGSASQLQFTFHNDRDCEIYFRSGSDGHRKSCTYAIAGSVLTVLPADESPVRFRYLPDRIALLLEGDNPRVFVREGATKRVDG